MSHKVTAAVGALTAVGAMLLASPDANADTRDEVITLICSALDDSPTPYTLDGIARMGLESGVPSREIASVLVEAVDEHCSRHSPLLTYWVRMESA